ncbi:MAG TPA: alpha/beta fold hydrolase [Gemmatimonadaceae bacterium]|nr:alpha/beta fold hydrolase [Gemmatimonadaceae bacterium]
MIARLPDGLELAYEEAGSGTALLLVHGFPHDHRLWEGQLTGLSTHARCLAPDLRGFGGSSVRGPYSMDRYADDLADFLGALGIARAVVCGLSLGGYVAFAMLRRHAALVRALVLADTRATPDTAEARANRERLVGVVEQQGMGALAERQLEGSVGRTTFARRPHVIDALRRMMTSAPAEGAIGALRAMIERPDSTPQLARIGVPALVIGGTEDTITTPDVLRALADAIPGSRLELLDRCGHVSAMERPDAFNRAIADFLGVLLDD